MVEGIRVDGSRKRQIGRGSELAAMMTDIAAHEDERISFPRPIAADGRASETAHVAHGVAGGVEQVERPVVEIVVCGEAAEGQWERGDFTEGAGVVVGFED